MRVETIGDATLYLGDCTEVMPRLDRVDVCLTDPPYGVGLDYGSYEDSQENLALLAAAWLPLAKDLAERVCFTPGVLNQWLYPQPTWVLSWHSPNSSSSGKWGFACWQPILVYGSDPYRGKGRQPDSFSYSVLESRIEGHPCPKPVRLMNRILSRVAKAEDAVLDPFMGSGTTGVACMQTGRKFIGIEREPKYFDIACRRIEQAVSQGQLFTPAAPKAEQMGLIA
jgi:site-specific DNA-methyltransferase (adenine-specific)/modification methylase